MSAYLNLPVQVSTMVCTTCGTEPFAWLVEVFVCPICGDHDYSFPMFAIECDRESAAREGETGEGNDGFVKGKAEIKEAGRKRKRPLCDG